MPTTPVLFTPDASNDQPDDVSTGSVVHSQHASSSSYNIRSSSPLSVFMFLDPSQAPLPTSYEELLSHHRRLRMTIDLLKKENLRLKAAKDAAREARIQEEIQTRMFTEPLSSYKRKDDLIVLSGALGLKMTGTIRELTAQVKSHIIAHPEIQRDGHFSGLFLPKRRRRRKRFLT